MIHVPDITELAEDYRRRAEPFALATVIRTAGATAAKPGARALIGADGTIREGWIGGGCVRTALTRAAARALEEGKPQLISLAPEQVLADMGRVPGDEVEGVRYARNGCPSEGSLDIFVEPVLPLPELVLYGASPVARALAALAGQFDWSVTTASAEAPLAERVPGRRRLVVVATQGQGDLASLNAALASGAEYLAFVGSRRKFATLSEKLAAGGADPAALAHVEAPAGLDIAAVTPDEIALSILARLTEVRRRAQRPFPQPQETAS